MIDILFNIIIYPIILLLEFSFSLSLKLFNEAGISVLFIGIVISVLCLPLYIVAEKWQQTERNITGKMKEKSDKIKKAFKGDERYMILSAYYRQNKYHPIYALRSSFGLLIQIPFFIAAYYYISHLEILKGVNFYFISDLGAPDALINIGGIKVNILPIAMTLITITSSYIYTKGFAFNEKIQLYIMAAVFLVLLYNSPSALVLYWTLNNIFSLLKNVYFRINNKNKIYFLIAFFSFCCVLLVIYSQIKYSYNYKGRLLVYFSSFLAFIPWLLIFFKKKIQNAANIIIYERSKSNIIFLLSIILIWLICGIFIPSQLIASSPQEFSFIDNYQNPLFFLFNTAIQAFGMLVFLPVCLYYLFSDNIKKYFSIIFFAVSIGIIINIFFFPGNYGNISLDFIFLNTTRNSTNEILFNLLILIIPLIVSFFLYIKKNKNFIVIPVLLAIVSFISISCINIFKINNSFIELKKYYVKQNNDLNEVSPFFTLSRTGKNIVVLMLDRGISVFIPYLFEESPELKEIYSGFTYFPNTVTFHGLTRISTPALFGGYEYSPLEINKRADTTILEKNTEALLLLPHILSENNFSVFVTDPPYAGGHWIGDLSIYDNYPEVKSYITDANYTDIWLKENNFELPGKSVVIKRNMFLYSIFRSLPLFFRPPLYMEGNWFSPSFNHTLRLTLDGYAVLDYLPRFTEITDEISNNALIMVNNTTHKSVFLQAPEYKPSLIITNYGTSIFAKINAYHTTAAAIKRLAEWIEFLKKENLYDNTRIIIVSDHGPIPNFVTKLSLDFNVDSYNALLMVKDFNASGDIKTDNAFMCNADVPYLSLLGIVDNPVNPFTSKEISNKMKDEPLYISMLSFTHYTNGNDNQIGLNPDYDYYVHENIFLKENWIRAKDYNKK